MSAMNSGEDDASKSMSRTPTRMHSVPQQTTKSICSSDLSSMLDDLSFMNSNSSTDNSQLPPNSAALVSPDKNQSNMDLPLPQGHNEYYPLEDSFSDLIASDRAADVFAGDAFPPFPETTQQTHHAGGYPLSGIEYPGPNDVMFGRGGASNQHIGNIRFRQLVAEHKVDYVTAAKGQKPLIAQRVVSAWRGLSPPGRFLRKTDPELGDNSFWHDVGEKQAQKKASQCLRERTSDIKPILKKLNEEQVIEEEKQSMKKKASSPKREAKKVAPTAQTDAKKKEAPSMKEIPIAVNSAGFPVSGSRISKQNEPKKVTKSSRSSKLNSPPRKPAPRASESARSGLRKSLVKEKKSRNIREEVSMALPSAASLVASFDDDSDDLHESSDSLSLLPADLRELMEAPTIGKMSESTIGSHSSNGDQTMATLRSTSLENLSTGSWFRSFRSFESSNRTLRTNGSNRTMMSATGSSLRGIAEEQSGDIMEESIDALDLAFPVRDEEFEARAANLQKLTWARNQNSNYSLMSDLTGDSSHQRRRMMRNKRIDSGASMTSNLTNLSDMSDSLKSMDLAL